MAFRLPSLNALRVFEAAARHLSFKKAADELSVTPAAVSHQIHGLEQQLGVLLFRRLTRALELTPEGEAMLPKVREGLACFSVAIERTRSRAYGGTLVVAAPPSFATRWLVPRLGRYTAAHPEVRLHVASSLDTIDSAERAVAAGSEGLRVLPDAHEISIRYGTGDYADCRVDRLLGVRYVAVCSPALLRCMRPLRTPSDIHHHVLIHDDTILDERERPSWREWCRLAGVTEADTDAGPHFTDSGLALSAAADGMGLVLASRPLIDAEIQAGRLVAPFDVAIVPRFAYYLVAPRAIADRPAVAGFRTWLLREARKSRTRKQATGAPAR
jgi:LysR family glycine cleavage system transcriptional activator